MINKKEKKTMVSKSNKMSRRDFLKVGTAAVGGVLLASCTPAATPTPEPTQAPQPTAKPTAEATQAPAATAAPTAVATQAPVATAAPAIAPGNLEVGVGWTQGTAFNLVKEVGDSMEKDFPGTKVIYTFNNTDARPLIEMRMEAGEPLDVDWAFTALRDADHPLVDKGYILDLTDPLDAKRQDGTRWVDDFNPLFITACTYKNRIWGVPGEIWDMLLFYNKALFDQWGLKPATTWKEFLTLCDTIKGKGVAPIAVTGQVADYVGIWSDHLYQRIAGKDKTLEIMWQDTTKTMAGDPDYLLAAQELNKLSTNGYLIDGWQGTDFTTAQLYFFQGKAAMILMGSWLQGEMKDSIPKGFQLGAAQFPQYEGSKQDQQAMFGNVTAWNVMAASKVPELATEFLRRYTSDKEAARRVDQLGSFMPNIKVSPPTGIYGAAEAMAAASTHDFILYFFGVASGQFGMSAGWYGPVVEMLAGKLTPDAMLKKVDANLASIRAQRKAAIP
jgi:ABC-type glycerol-3-phosphate transport system substrate-binding protein